MDDTLQYIIVIIAVIAAIISKIRNQEKVNKTPESKKPVLTPAEDRRTNPSPEGWEKWFDISEEKAQPVKQEPVVVNIHAQSIHPDIYKKTNPAMNTNNKEKIEAQNMYELPEDKVDIQFNSMEEVRKAIIYSEIIQRKY